VRFVPRPKGLKVPAEAYGLPLPTTEAQVGRLLDRWEGELEAKLAVAAALFAFSTPAVAAWVNAAVPHLLDGALIVTLAIVAALSLFGIPSGLSALSLTLRSGLGDASLFVKIGVPLSMVAYFFLLLFAGAAALFGGLGNQQSAVRAPFGVLSHCRLTDASVPSRWMPLCALPQTPNFGTPSPSAHPLRPARRARRGGSSHHGRERRGGTVHLQAPAYRSGRFEGC